jgi:PKD repeat protein
MKNTILFLFIIACVAGCFKETTVLVNADFIATVAENNYTAPLQVHIENTTTGADFYLWTFEGGSPATSTQKNPGTIIYSQAGTYTITLEAWNDTQRNEKEFTFTVDSTVQCGFETEILINDFAPAFVKITNTTQGASTYRWTFEGGSPETSTAQHPDSVFFSEEGEHRITLEASNGGETFTTTKIITLQAPLYVNFEIEPSFDDFDYEAPFRTNLVNKSRNGLTYKWKCERAHLDWDWGRNTELYISQAGSYTISLTVSNGKETKTASENIYIKPNTNLYTMRNVKFGIKAAANSVGYAYSLPQRTIVKTNEISYANGKTIALLFSAINASYNQCFFVSPDYADQAGFFAISYATKTYFVNKLEESSIVCTDADFEAMTNDDWLQPIDIKSAGTTTGTSWFDNSQLPRFVLFETETGIKGVIKIKDFVQAGNNSYILTDIKHQKTAR